MFEVFLFASRGFFYEKSPQMILRDLLVVNKVLRFFDRVKLIEIDQN